MDHYQEIRLLPDPEHVPPVLMNLLFGKLALIIVSSTDHDYRMPERGAVGVEKE